MTSDAEDEKFVDDLILSGALEPAGLDQNGEMLFTFTEKLAQVDPKLYQSMQEVFYEDVQFLWMHGFIDMDITSANPTVRLTERAFDMNAVSKLPPEMSRTLGYIIYALRKN